MITIVRLVDGTELIGDVINSNDKVTIKSPLQIGYYFKTPTSIPIITMHRFMPFAKDDVFSFYLDHVMSTAEPKTSVIKYYNEMVKELAILDVAIEDELSDKQEEITDTDKEIAAAIIEKTLKKPVLN